MYTKDKNHRITLRLNDDQFNFVKFNADTLGVSPSDFLRMVVNASMTGFKAANTVIEKAEDKLKEGLGRENDKTDRDDIV